MASPGLFRAASLVVTALQAVGAQDTGGKASLRGGSGVGSSAAPTRLTTSIGEGELRDKFEGFWVGQLVGNFMGLPFEFVYMDEPMPFLPETYYDERSANASGVRCNRDSRGSVPARLSELQGACTDDDADVELVTLHAVLEHGLDLAYPDIARCWQRYVRVAVSGTEALWLANRRARELMDEGLLPPQTGSRENNTWWWTIDPQLVNEIWSAFYPGMVDKAVERAEWGARITSSSWGTHATRFYGAAISAAFFVKDVETLYDIAIGFVPRDSPLRRGLLDVRAWRWAHDDWRVTRQHVRSKYLHYPDTCGGAAPGESWSDCYVSSMINGLLGAMALLYGEGDFMKTVGIAIAAGFDCDNQAATLAGLLGVMHGGSKIPRSLTHEIAGNRWDKPFNDRYVNERRPPLPRLYSNSDIVTKIMRLALGKSPADGGSLQKGEQAAAEDGGWVYHVPVSPVLAQALAPPP